MRKIRMTPPVIRRKVVCRVYFRKSRVMYRGFRQPFLESETGNWSRDIFRMGLFFGFLIILNNESDDQKDNEHNGTGLCPKIDHLESCQCDKYCPEEG